MPAVAAAKFCVPEPSERMAAFQKQIDAGAIGLEPDQAVKSWSSDPERKEWILSLCTPHPKGTFERGVTLTGREAEIAYRHYILAEKNTPSPFWGEYERVRNKDGWTSERMPTMHDAMIEAPEDLAARLNAYASSLKPEGPAQ